MRILSTAAALLALGFATGGCDWMRPKQAPGKKTPKELAAEQAERIRKTCGSEATYDRLKEVVFDEAARIRNGDPRNLDPIAAGSMVRMERPLVKSRDEKLNVTVCTGHFILELPPGAENAFDGKRRVEADIEYSAQAAADGSGLVYQMDGAEPIIYRLAAFGLAPGAVAAAPRPARRAQPDRAALSGLLDPRELDAPQGSRRRQPELLRARRESLAADLGGFERRPRRFQGRRGRRTRGPDRLVARRARPRQGRDRSNDLHERGGGRRPPEGRDLHRRRGDVAALVRFPLQAGEGAVSRPRI
jgi:hypothetical protein